MLAYIPYMDPMGMGKNNTYGPPAFLPRHAQLEYALWQTHGVRVVQRTLAQLKQQATMEQDGTLRLDGSEALGSWDGCLGLGNPHKFSTVMAMNISYNWLFQWDYTFYKWGFVSTYNW